MSWFSFFWAPPLGSPGPLGGSSGPLGGYYWVPWAAPLGSLGPLGGSSEPLGGAAGLQLHERARIYMKQGTPHLGHLLKGTIGSSSTVPLPPCFGFGKWFLIFLVFSTSKIRFV